MGQGIDQTIIKVNSLGVSGSAYGRLSDLTVSNWVGTILFDVDIARCKITSIIPRDQTVGLFVCIITTNLYNPIYAGSNNSILNLDLDNKKLFFNKSLFDHCKIDFIEEEILKYKGLYLAFNNCKFKLGSEIEATELTGKEEANYRADFLRRCNIGGIGISEDDVKNWVFANEAAENGIVKTGSIIDDFQTAISNNTNSTISFGYKTDNVQAINITGKKSVNIRTSIGSIDGEKMSSDGNIIKLDSNFPITHKATGSISSKVISLKEIQKLSSIDVLSNFPTGIGLGVTSEHAIKGEGVLVKDINDKKKKLEVGQRYIVRASHEGEGAIQYASFVYNNGNYNTNLATRYNILIATDSNEFTSVVGDPILYPVPNPELYQTYEIRIVDDIPPTIYGKGQTLAAGYWYIVEPKDGIENGSAKCGGIDYPTYCSFYVESNILVEELKDAVVRRCFSEEYSKEQDPFYNDTDGKSKQKPIWFSVVGNDMRGLRKGNSIYEDEMQFDAASQKYIGSGYPDFYSLINGHTGIRLPSFPIKGKYFQLRVKVSSFNIM